MNRDNEFERLFELVPDWPTAVANLRKIVSSDEGPVEPRLRLLKDTAAETILAVLADHEVEYKSASMNRYTGGEIDFSAPPFHTYVLKKAFRCHRAEAVPADARGAVEAAEAELKRARERFRAAIVKLPPEMRERGRE